MNDKHKVLIFDTTLRDGEQSPGASMNLTEKLEVAFEIFLCSGGPLGGAKGGKVRADAVGNDDWVHRRHSSYSAMLY